MNLMQRFSHIWRPSKCCKRVLSQGRSAVQSGLLQLVFCIFTETPLSSARAQSCCVLLPHCLMVSRAKKQTSAPACSNLLQQAGVLELVFSFLGWEGVFVQTVSKDW
jgi:hypothetical protein